jgi:hypothetical protein
MDPAATAICDGVGVRSGESRLSERSVSSCQEWNVFLASLM